MGNLIQGRSTTDISPLTGRGRVEEINSINGAVSVRQTASDVAFPESEYSPWSGAAGAADNAVIYTSPDVSGNNFHTIENRSAVAIDIFVTVDGTFNASQPAHGVVLTDSLTGLDVTSLTIPTNKTGELRGKYKNIKVLQAAAGTINAGEVVGAHGVL